MNRRYLGFLCSLVSLLAAPAWAQPRDAEPAPTAARVAPGDGDLVAAFERKDYAGAVAMLRERLARNPRDPFLTYNLACAQAMLGETDAAAESLIDAISFGFVDLRYAERDPHLDPIRDNAKYRLVIRGWRELLDARGKADAAGAAEALGQGYESMLDHERRLSIVWSMDPQSFEEAQREMRRVAEWAAEHVFGAEALSSDDPARPDPWVMVLLPTRRDFVRLVGAPGVGGYYDRDRRRLVTQDIGPSLRHEFFHVLHWRHAERLGQQHALWIMEGLASLLEDVDETPEGAYVLAPSWRTNIARRLDRANRITPWRDFFAMPREGFMGDRARANYAQARAIFMFLHERGVLRRWYDAYVRTFAQDSTGAAATEQVFEAPLAEVERQFRFWLRELPEVAEQARPGEADLGLALAQAADGLVVTEPVAGSRARVVGGESLRRRDVITAVDGKPVRTMDDLYRALSGATIGQRVRVEARRGAMRFESQLELISRDAPGILRDF